MPEPHVLPISQGSAALIAQASAAVQAAQERLNLVASATIAAYLPGAYNVVDANLSGPEPSLTLVRIDIPAEPEPQQVVVA